jgi:hypothetical protein
MNSFMNSSSEFLEECPQPSDDSSNSHSLCFGESQNPPPIESFVEISHHPLIGKWDLYYHLPHIKEWDINSYTIIMNDINTVEKMVAINKHIPELIVKYCMLFVMKTRITPRWEDPKNRNGGCFSFKVVNKFVYSVWKSLFYSMCGETIFEKDIHNNLVNGISISPKKNFCIIKIWMKNCSVQDPTLIVQIPYLTKQGCLFNKHEVND